MVLEKTLESPLNCREIQPVHQKADQSWVFIGRPDVEAETPIVWPPDGKSWLIWKDPDAGKDWGHEEKGMTEDEMVGWHHQFNAHGSGWTPGVGDRQWGLVCCGSWGRKVSDTTERLNWTEHGEKERKQSQPDSLTGGDEADSLVRPKRAEITDLNCGEESVEQKKDPGDLRRSPSGIQQRNAQRPSVRNHLRPGRNHLKRLQEPKPGAHSVPGILSILLSQAGKTSPYSRMNGVVGKVLPPRQEIISPSPRAPLDAPNKS